MGGSTVDGKTGKVQAHPAAASSKGSASWGIETAIRAVRVYDEDELGPEDVPLPGLGNIHLRYAFRLLDRLSKVPAGLRAL